MERSEGRRNNFRDSGTEAWEREGRPEATLKRKMIEFKLESLEKDNFPFPWLRIQHHVKARAQTELLLPCHPQNRASYTQVDPSPPQ